MKTEQQTRIELIDTALNKAGWDVNDPGQVVQEYDIIINPLQVAEAVTPYSGHQFSDYVLLGRDRKPLAVVEAKKTSKDAALGREQAKQYCYNIRKAFFIQFIRHILGIEILASFPDTVARAFDQFTAAHTNLNSRQLEFLRLLKDFIIEREKVEKRDLIQSPFTILHPQGIRGVFRPAEIDEILQLTEKLAA